MSKTNALTQNKPVQLILQVCAIDADALDKKMKLTPLGSVQGIDGRYFEIEGNVLLKRLKKNKLELPLIVEHGYTKTGSEAAGWFKNFTLEADGIYATLTLNEAGKALIDAKKYKYLSPEFLVDYETKQVNQIVGVGLVNQPNLLNQSLNNQQTLKDNTENTMPKANNTAPTQAQMDALIAQNNALQTQLDAQAKALLVQKIDNAINDGKLLPNRKEFALTLEENALNAYLTLEAGTTTVTQNNQINATAQSTAAPCAIEQQFNGE